MTIKTKSYLLQTLLVTALLALTGPVTADMSQININGIWLTDDMLNAVEDELGFELEDGYYLFDYANGLRHSTAEANGFASGPMHYKQGYGNNAMNYDYGNYSQPYSQNDYGNQGSGQPYYNANRFGYTGSDGNCSYVYIPGGSSVMTGDC